MNRRWRNRDQRERRKPVTIEKGKDWGTTGSLAADAPVVNSDAELAALFSLVEGMLVGPEQVGLTGGDLATTLGARSSEAELRGSPRTLLPLDLASVHTGEGDAIVMAASVVVRSPLWAGRVRAVMNASHFGSWNASPAGHPNDGRVDVIVANLSFGDRLKARKRLPAGIHVPHPDISIRRQCMVQWEVSTREKVWIDGVLKPGVRSVEVLVHPDATVVAI